MLLMNAKDKRIAELEEIIKNLLEDNARLGDKRSEQLHFKPMELFVVVQVLKKYNVRLRSSRCGI